MKFRRWWEKLVESKWTCPWRCLVGDKNTDPNIRRKLGLEIHTYYIYIISTSVAVEDIRMDDNI